MEYDLNSLFGDEFKNIDNQWYQMPMEFSTDAMGYSGSPTFAQSGGWPVYTSFEDALAAANKKNAEAGIAPYDPNGPPNQIGSWYPMEATSYQGTHESAPTGLYSLNTIYPSESSGIHKFLKNNMPAITFGAMGAMTGAGLLSGAGFSTPTAAEMAGFDLAGESALGAGASGLNTSAIALGGATPESVISADTVGATIGGQNAVSSVVPGVAGAGNIGSMTTGGAGVATPTTTATGGITGAGNIDAFTAGGAGASAATPAVDAGIMSTVKDLVSNVPGVGSLVSSGSIGEAWDAIKPYLPAAVLAGSTAIDYFTRDDEIESQQDAYKNAFDQYIDAFKESTTWSDADRAKAQQAVSEYYARQIAAKNQQAADLAAAQGRGGGTYEGMVRDIERDSYAEAARAIAGTYGPSGVAPSSTMYSNLAAIMGQDPESAFWQDLSSLGGQVGTMWILNDLFGSDKEKSTESGEDYMQAMMMKYILGS